MNITLYKNCRINKNYDILYNKGYHLNTYNEDAHTYYLSTLAKVTLDIGDVYLNDSGRLILDLYNTTSGKYLNQYNYMAFNIYDESGYSDIDTQIAHGNYVCDNYNKLTRYAFITKVEYTTGSIIIDYECDIYHSYCRLINTCYARLIRYNDTTIKKAFNVNADTPLEELGDLKYISQSALISHEIDLTNGGFYMNSEVNKGADRECYCFMEIQYYDSAGAGDTSSRVCDTVLVDYNNNSGNIIDRFVATVSKWENMLSYLKVYSSDANGKTVIMDKYYEVMNVYLYPKDNDKDNTIKNRIEELYDEIIVSPVTALVTCVSDSVNVSVSYSSGTGTGTYTNSHNFISLSKFCSFPFLFEQYVSGTSLDPISTMIPLISGWTCTGNFKRRGIGFYTHMFEIPKNNQSFSMNLYMTFDNFNIKFFMELNNEVIEITDDLKLEIPISVDTADATQLAKINRTLNNKQINVDQATGAITGVTGTFMSAISGYRQAGGIGAAMNIIGGGASLANNMISKNIDRERNNIQSYTTNAGTRTNSNASINCKIGIIDFCEVPINNNEVALDIRRHGYKLNYDYSYLIDNVLFLGTEEINNGTVLPYYKFDSVVITGEFSDAIRQQLETIYEKGFRLVPRLIAENGTEDTLM